MKWKALAVVVKIVVKRIYNQLHPPDIYNNKKERRGIAATAHTGTQTIQQDDVIHQFDIRRGALCV